jgi:hypothetical protein
VGIGAQIRLVAEIHDRAGRLGLGTNRRPVLLQPLLDRLGVLFHRFEARPLHGYIQSLENVADGAGADFDPELPLEQVSDHIARPQRIVEVQLPGIGADQLPQFVRPERLVELARAPRNRLGFQPVLSIAPVLLEPIVNTGAVKIQRLDHRRRAFPRQHPTDRAFANLFAHRMRDRSAVLSVHALDYIKQPNCVGCFIASGVVTRTKNIRLGCTSDFFVFEALRPTSLTALQNPHVPDDPVFQLLLLARRLGGMDTRFQIAFAVFIVVEFRRIRLQMESLNLFFYPRQPFSESKSNQAPLLR